MSGPTRRDSLGLTGGPAAHASGIQSNAGRRPPAVTGGSHVGHCHRETTTKLRPLGDRVVIQPTPREEMTKSGIVLRTPPRRSPRRARSSPSGPGRILDDGKREPMDVKEGDKVLYAKYAGTEFKLDGEELLIVSQKDILAIVED